MKIPKIIAHRGLPHQAPENSIQGLLLVKDLGIPGVEADTQPTRDGQWVLCHDPSLTLASGGPILVRELDSRDLADHKLSNGESLPILFQALKALGPETFLNLEIKWPYKRPLPFAERLLQTLLRHRNPENTLLTSFNPAVLRTLRRGGSPYPLGLIYGDLPGVPPFLRKGLGRWLCQVEHLSVFKDNLLYSDHKPKVPYLVWTVNDSPTAQQVLTAGASGVISDQPDLLLQELPDLLLSGSKP